MTEEGRVHGSQRLKPGVVTFCVVDDDMFGQSWFVQISCIAQRIFAELMIRVGNHPHKVYHSHNN